MKKMQRLTFFLLLLFTITSCKDGGPIFQSITGSPYEVLVVVRNKTWDAESGKSLFNLLNGDMPSLPQKESYFQISNCPPSEFNSLFKPTRNIIFVDIDEKRYTKGNIVFSKDKWAKPQALVKIVAPNDTSFVQLIEARGKEIIDYLVQAELSRQIEHIKKHSNKNFMAMIQKQFDVFLVVPSGINKYKKGKNVIWLSTGSAEVRQDLLIYSYPYTDIKMLTEQSLLQKRDSINKAFIPGPVENSYVGTEYKYDKPTFTPIWVQDKYCAEIKGMWKVYGDASMGGPFISHTRIDELHQRVITVEGFVYAPGKNKRNHIRQMEAILHTLKVPVVMNELVVTDKKQKK
ncbi:MAG: DUF4837 family protein [Paludibacteraceae bacterium]|nr:DUF4837 family protein [Paludibacteraceae bacterium]MBN2787667.1 DUF4837 family protein [Paludibacteraceae bacterium]